MKRRVNQFPKLTLPFWRQEGKLWYAESAGLVAAVTAMDLDEDDQKRVFGAGFSELHQVLQGKGVDIWSANHIEYGLIHGPNLGYVKKSGTGGPGPSARG